MWKWQVFCSFDEGCHITNFFNWNSCSINEKIHSRVKTWTRRVDLFSKDYIIVPVCDRWGGVNGRRLIARVLWSNPTFLLPAIHVQLHRLFINSPSKGTKIHQLHACGIIVMMLWHNIISLNERCFQFLFSTKLDSSLQGTLVCGHRMSSGDVRSQQSDATATKTKDQQEKGQEEHG